MVTFDVAVPKSLSGDERAALESLAQTLGGNPRDHLGV
jgi:hypothetical protein